MSDTINQRIKSFKIVRPTGKECGLSFEETVACLTPARLVTPEEVAQSIRDCIKALKQ